MKFKLMLPQNELGRYGRKALTQRQEERCLTQNSKAGPLLHSSFPLKTKRFGQARRAGGVVRVRGCAGAVEADGLHGFDYWAT